MGAPTSGLKASYSVAELAKLFAWSKKTVRGWIRTHGLPTVLIGKRKIVVPLEAFSGDNLSLLRSASYVREVDESDE